MKLDDAIAQLQHLKRTLVEMAPSTDAMNPDMSIDFGFDHNQAVYRRELTRFTLAGSNRVGRFQVVCHPGQRF